MSRTLARLRAATGDALLVRAGRGLVPTPRAALLRDQVRRLVQEAEAVLRPAGALDLRRLARTFTLRTADGFAEAVGPALVARIAAEAPGVRLRFMAKADKDGALLRDGTVDLETGVAPGTAGPELRVQKLFEDRFIGVVRPGHALAAGQVTAERYAACGHVMVSRRGLASGPIDAALRPLTRRVAAIVDGFAAALALARETDLVASVPARHTARLRAGLHAFPLPVSLAPITISLLWHPRLDADPAHRWLRAHVRAACAALAQDES
jgi:DNA-binding transcriptional LysR family regulator